MLFLILFHIIGHPIVALVLRFSHFPQKLANLDFVQRLPLEFVTGGAVIYLVTVALTPFQGFNALACWFVTCVAAVFYLLLHLTRIASFHTPSRYSLIAFAGFVLALAIRVGPMSNFVLGSNQDISWHTLLTYSIINNGGIPFSVIQPFVLQVPLGVQTNLAYFSLISGIPAEMVAFHSTVLFSVLIGLAAYLFGSIICSKRFGLYVSLIMIAFSYYPSAITWGSDWLLLGLAVFFVAAALVFPFSNENLPLPRSGLVVAFLPALITGFLASTFIPLYVILLIVSIFFVLLSRKEIVNRLKRLGLIFILGIPLFALWLYRFFFLSQPMGPYLANQSAAMMHNQAYASAAFFLPIKNLYSPYVFLSTLRNWLTWDDQNGWTGAYFFFPLLVVGCIILSVYILRRRFNAFNPHVPRYVISVFLMMILWGLNGPLGLFYETGFGLGIMISELDKIAPIIGTILLPFVAACGLLSIQKFIRKRTKVRAWISGGVILVLILGSVAIAPYTKTWLVGSYNDFATSTQADYELLNWMKTGISPDSVVLVHPYDAGQYVPSISGKKTIGIASTGVLFLNQQYEDLNYHIRHYITNSVTVSLLRELGIDYVFVGGQPFKEKWDENYFFENQLYFIPVQSFESLVGNTDTTYSAYLFAVKIPDGSVGAGLVDNIFYTGISDGKTLIDFKHMAVYNLETGEGVYLEIGLRNQADKVLEKLNVWNQPQSVTVTTNGFQARTADFTLTGSKYTFEISISSQSAAGINLHFSVENAPAQSSTYLTYSPIHNVTQSHVNLTTDTANRWSSKSLLPIKAVRPEGNTFFQIVPRTDVILSIYKDENSTGYLTLISNAAFDVTISTLPTG
jgi:hypothetical protein